MTLSGWLGGQCRYSPSCSVYALESLRGWPLPTALGKIAWRLLRCGPWATGGDDPPGHRFVCAQDHHEALTTTMRSTT